jgi:hypothetical protein
VGVSNVLGLLPAHSRKGPANASTRSHIIVSMSVYKGTIGGDYDMEGCGLGSDFFLTRKIMKAADCTIKPAQSAARTAQIT